MIQLSEEAAKEVKRLQEENEDLKDYYLRCGVMGGGCAGLSYALGFDKDTTDTDIIEEQHGIKVVCDNKSNLYINQATLEFSKELIGGGFKFLNKNAKNCGCGKSFNL